MLDAEEEDEEEVEEEEEESEEDAIERLKTEIGDRYDEETGKLAIVQVSLKIKIQILICCCYTSSIEVHMYRWEVIQVSGRFISCDDVFNSHNHFVL